MVWSLQYYRFHFLQRQNNLHKTCINDNDFINSGTPVIVQYDDATNKFYLYANILLACTGRIVKQNKPSSFPFYPFSFIFVLYSACVQRNKIVSPGVQLSPAAPVPLPLAVSGQSSSYQCYGQSSLSHQHTFTHGDQTRGTSPYHITMSVLL